MLHNSMQKHHGTGSPVPFVSSRRLCVNLRCCTLQLFIGCPDLSFVIRAVTQTVHMIRLIRRNCEQQRHDAINLSFTNKSDAQ